MIPIEKTITKWFTYHPPTPAQAQAYEEIRLTALGYAMRLTELLPVGSNEFNQAMNALNEVVMWANAGIARAGATEPGDGV